jgi:hypothetical protein
MSEPVTRVYRPRVVRTVDDVRDESDTAPLLEIETTRSLRRWVRRAADRVDDDDLGGRTHLPPSPAHVGASLASAVELEG